jgi:hypothetical protein
MSANGTGPGVARMARTGGAAPALLAVRSVNVLRGCSVNRWRSQAAFRFADADHCRVGHRYPPAVASLVGCPADPVGEPAGSQVEQAIPWRSDPPLDQHHLAHLSGSSQRGVPHHEAAVAVADQHDGLARVIQCFDYVADVVLEPDRGVELARALAKAGQCDRLDRLAVLFRPRQDALPAPSAVPGAVHQ